MMIKREAKTNPQFGCAPEKRPVDELIKYGVINLDKPSGPTSHQVSDFVQRILNVKKAGHSGTLDPHVTGVLPVAIERATRLAQLLLTGGKGYVGIMHLHKDVEEKELREAVKKFIGKIHQLPPIRSAVKRQLRERSIYLFELLEIDGRDVLFRVDCEAGTYIRKLCHDLGGALGVGAHMTCLRRTHVGNFNEETLVTLQDVQDAYHFWKEESNEKFIRHCIQPAERLVEHLPKLWVLDSAVESICHGSGVGIPGVSKLSSFHAGAAVAVMTLKDELIALGTACMGSDEIIKNEKGLAASVHKVFMKTEYYLPSRD